jgi:Tol biopolymer transport system component
MTLAAGTTFGPYEILELVGSGGMGEVYRARDTRLGREVAVKTLPATLARDEDRLRRFEIEARAASQLSHPNILTIYDVGAVDDRPFIVSELLEGETLRLRLNSGPLPPRKSVEIASAVANALAEAHQRGIVHRDLKPENLFLTRDGRLKILDFGVAKLTLPEPVKGVSASTVQLLTDIGSAVGTPGYMAPEQVRGEPVDHRSDIFALGAILQEMLTGAAVFQRDSRIATLSAVLESIPPELPDHLPPALRRIVQRCLEKHADERFQSARDLAFALNGLSDVAGTASGVVAGHRGSRRVDWRIAAAIALASAAVAVMITAGLRSQPPPPVKSAARFVIEPPTRFVAMSLSPDGRTLAYATRGTAANQIYLRSLDRFEAIALEGSELANGPVFSPDGKWVAYHSRGKLKKLPITGGTPVTLCDAAEFLSMSWSETNHLFTAQRKSAVMRVSADGGVSEIVTSLDPARGELDHHTPRLLPGGKALLFTIHAGPEMFRVAVRSLETGEQRILVDDAFDAQYVASGHLLFARGNAIYAAPFDVSRLQLTGPERLILEQVYTEPYDGYAGLAVANDGTITYAPETKSERRALVWVTRDGSIEPLPIPESSYDYPALSPDDKRLAVHIANGTSKNIFLFELATASLTRVTLGGIESKPIWAPDGKQITYASGKGADRHVFMQPLDGSAPPHSLYRTHHDVWPAAWTPDMRSLLFVETPPTEFADIKVLHLGATPAVEPLLVNDSPEFYPSLSPDGRWLAYVSFEGARSEVYVRTLHGGAPRQISANGGSHARWSRDGREVFYLRAGGYMMSVPVNLTPALTFGKPVTLFQGRYVATGLGPPSYDVTSDGQRFLMVKPSPEELAPGRIHVVLNWFEELNRRVPTGH